LVFLAGTSEMQSVAASATIGANNNSSSSSPILETFEKIKGINTVMKGIYDQFKSKFDKEGNIDTIIRYLAPEPALKKIGEQVLTSQIIPLNDAAMVQYANKCYVIASVVLIVGTVVISFKIEKGIIAAYNKVAKTHMETATETKTEAIGITTRVYLANILFLVSAGFWFQGFYYYTQVSIDSGNDIRVIGPLLLKLFAAALFTIQPMTTLMRSPTHNDMNYTDFSWANFYAVLLLHMGNLIAVAFTLKQFNFISLFSAGNQYTISIALSFMIATTFLMAGDYRSGEQLGLNKDTNQPLIYSLIGDAFLLLGSILLTVSTNQ